MYVYGNQCYVYLVNLINVNDKMSVLLLNSPKTNFNALFDIFLSLIEEFRYPGFSVIRSHACTNARIREGLLYVLFEER